MRRVPLLIALALVLPAAVSAQEYGNRRRTPCDSSDTTPSWQVYVNRQAGFCFRYPREYRFISWSSRSPQSLPNSDLLVELQRPGSGSTIQVSLIHAAFTNENLLKFAPTGQESPPVALRRGSRTFYYYGPGGGGGCYPDQYFIAWKQRILQIAFDGCVDDKSPPAGVKIMEDLLLSEFSSLESP